MVPIALLVCTEGADAATVSAEVVALVRVAIGETVTLLTLSLHHY